MSKGDKSMDVKTIEIYAYPDASIEWPFYARFTLVDNTYCIDTPGYDTDEPENLPETIDEYKTRMQAENPNTQVFIGDAPHEEQAEYVDPDLPIAKYRERVGAVMGHFLLYPNDVTERVNKARYERTRVPERKGDDTR